MAEIKLVLFSSLVWNVPTLEDHRNIQPLKVCWNIENLRAINIITFLDLKAEIFIL